MSKLPTKFQPVCYVDSCDRYHACDGIRTGTNPIVVQSDSSPYAAAVLFGLLGLLGITECKTKGNELRQIMSTWLFVQPQIQSQF